MLEIVNSMLFYTKNRTQWLAIAVLSIFLCSSFACKQTIIQRINKERLTYRSASFYVIRLSNMSLKHDDQDVQLSDVIHMQGDGEGLFGGEASCRCCLDDARWCDVDFEPFVVEQC